MLENKKENRHKKIISVALRQLKNRPFPCYLLDIWLPWHKKTFGCHLSVLSTRWNFASSCQALKQEDFRCEALRSVHLCVLNLSFWTEQCILLTSVQRLAGSKASGRTVFVWKGANWWSWWIRNFDKVKHSAALVQHTDRIVLFSETNIFAAYQFPLDLFCKKWQGQILSTELRLSHPQGKIKIGFQITEPQRPWASCFSGSWMWEGRSRKF